MRRYHVYGESRFWEIRITLGTEATAATREIEEGLP